MVITLDKRKRPLGVCTERRARILLEKKRACVYKAYPYVIMIKDKDTREIKPEGTYRVKIDPGAKYTGIAVVRNEDNAVVFFQQIEHRGDQVKKNLQPRSQCRRNHTIAGRSGETNSSRKGRNRSMTVPVLTDGFHHPSVPSVITSSHGS